MIINPHISLSRLTNVRSSIYLSASVSLGRGSRRLGNIQSSGSPWLRINNRVVILIGRGDSPRDISTRLGLCLPLISFCSSSFCSCKRAISVIQLFTKQFIGAGIYGKKAPLAPVSALINRRGRTGPLHLTTHTPGRWGS